MSKRGEKLRPGVNLLDLGQVTAFLVRGVRAGTPVLSGAHPEDTVHEWEAAASSVPAWSLGDISVL